MLAGLLTLAWTHPGFTQPPSSDQVESIPARQEELPPGELRFGDPESFLLPAEGGRAAEKTVRPVPPPSEPEMLPESSPADREVLAARVREIVSTAQPGKAFSRQLDDLVQLGSTAVDPLAAIFADGSRAWERRWLAAMALGHLGGERSREALTAGLGDSLFLMRMAAARGLGVLDDLAAGPALRKALPDRAMVVRAAVVDALGALRDPDAVPDLVAEFSASRNFHRGKSLWVRAHVLRALGQIGDSQAIPVAVKALSDRETSIRLEACAALRDLVPEAPPARMVTVGEGCVEKWLAWKSISSAESAPPSHSDPADLPGIQ